MNIAATIARILLGVVFVAAGASAFLIKTPPPMPGLAGEFNAIFIASHWEWFLGAAQCAIGALLLANRFVPLALIMLAAFLYNSFAFHITMAQAALPAPVIVLVLWCLIASRYRAVFAPVLAAKSL